jgi:hypothetical protein
MRVRICLNMILTMSLGLTMIVRVHGQVAPSAEGGPTDIDDETMMTPPPVSGIPYANSSSSEERKNYLSAGVTIDPAYVNNLLPYATATPVGDFTISVLPTFSLNRTTPRQKDVISYSPNFTFYEPTSSLDSIGQSAAITFQYRVSPQVSLVLQDSFLRTSDVFNESYPFSNPVSGSTLSPTPTVIAPYAEQLVNTTSGDVSYQFGRNAMVGGGASYSIFDLPNPQQAEGLYNSNTADGMAFYARRLNRTQYLGLVYQYSHNLTYPLNQTSEVQTHNISPFYTFYFNRVFSFSVAAGFQRVGISGNASPASSSWSPSGTASFGWQGTRAFLAGGFSRSISSGNGLLGAFSTSAITGSGGWRLAHSWKAAASVSYSNINEVTTSTNPSLTNGNTFSGQGTLARSINERLSITFGYQYLHEDYPGLAATTADPNSDREFGSIIYSFNRPLGR